MKNKYKYILIGVTIFGLVSCGYERNNVSQDDTKKMESSIEVSKIQRVSVIKPSKKEFGAEIQITGTAMPNKKVKLHAMESGIVKSITRDIGDYVSRGSVIARLGNPEIGREIERLQVQVDAKKAIYDRLQAIKDKTPDLTTSQIFDEAKGNYLAAKSELNSIMDRRNFLNVTAPFSGIITKRYVDNGALIQSGITNSNSIAIVEIQQINPIRLVIPLPESNASSIEKGTEVNVIFPELSGEIIKAKVSRTAGVLDFDSKTMQIEIDIPNRNGKIKPGMYAKVSIQLESRKDVLSLPVTAQYMYRNQLFLMVVKNNIVKRVLLKKGLSNTENFEILNSEIDENSLIIIKGKGLVKGGQKVEAVIE